MPVRRDALTAFLHGEKLERDSADEARLPL
jgi:hypothetical protein